MLCVELQNRSTPARQKKQLFGQPVDTADGSSQKQQQGKRAFYIAAVPGGGVTDKAGQDDGGDGGYQSSTCNIAKKASWGTSTDPICFMRFLPAFCFSRSLRLRLMSPP